VPAAVPPISQRPARPGPAGWAYALTPEEQFEWLVDCYRLRIDDEYAWSGEFRGLYEEMANQGRNPATVQKDFFAVSLHLMMERHLLLARGEGQGGA
jgi:hypothetical protein